MLRWLQTSIFGSPVRSFSHIDFGSDFNPDFRTRRKLLQEHMGGGLDLVTQPFGPEFPTLHDVMQKAFADYTSLPCMGTREYIKMHKGTSCAGDYVAGKVFRFMCAESLQSRFKCFSPERKELKQKACPQRFEKYENKKNFNFIFLNPTH
jgi:hypothetical protein